MESLVTKKSKQFGYELIINLESCNNYVLHQPFIKKFAIKLCDDIFYLSNRQKIDKFLRSYRNFISNGVIEVNGQKMLTSTAKEIISFVPVIYERLNELGCVLCVN